MDVADPDDTHTIPFDELSRSVTVTAHTKQNCRDNALDPESDFMKFLLSLSDKSNVGLHIDNYNRLISDIVPRCMD